MKEKIIAALDQIAAEQNFKILLACETGSRAWGFPSPDSDYDVRLIYAHEPDWYLSLNEKKDTYDQMLEDRIIDLSGWDLRKSLRLLAKSNVALLEWIQSDIIYSGNDAFRRELRGIAVDCFSPITTMHHYLSMSKKYTERVQGDADVRLKDYLYALRTALAGAWVREKQEVPPLIFSEMFELISEDLQSEIEEMIVLKGQKNEAYRHPINYDLREFLKECVRRNEEVAQSLPSTKPDWNHLNQFFKKWIK